jgi:hypothetical protein
MTFTSQASFGPGSGIRLNPADWSLLAGSHPNVLISGPEQATHAFIHAVAAQLQSPVRCCIASEVVPSLGDTDGTIVLRDVDALDADRQNELLLWLDDAGHGRTQVVCTTRKPLYDRVQAGAFLDRLYYRLNVINFEVTAE